MMTGRWLNRRTLGTGLAGLACLGFALFLLPRGIGAVAAEEELSAARPCPAGAAWDADCRQDVIGTVASVTRSGSGRTLEYVLEAWTAHGYVDVEFLGSNSLVRRAQGGDELVLTETRGKVLTVSGYGLREGARDVAKEGTQSELAGTSLLLGLAMLLLPVAVTTARDRGDRIVLLRGVPQFVMLTSLMAGVVLVVNAVVLAFGTEPRVDLGVVAGSCAAVLALCVMVVRISHQ